MKIKSLISSVAVVMLIACMAMSFTNRDEWRSLGSKTVDYKIDHDVLNSGIRDGRFQQLRFVVTGGALNMYKCTIHFVNGGTQDVELRQNFSRRSTSRIIDLQGNERFIDRISFWYDTKNFSRGKAVLTVFGK